MLNRHGLVAGATGTGKTKTLQLLAEQLSAAGVPVFAADIKGDLSGHRARPGEPSDKLTRAHARRSARTGGARGFPAEFFALGGQGTGVPLRATMTAFGPLLLCKVLGLNDTQESSLGLVFHYADQAGPAAARPRRPARGAQLPRPATRARPSSRSSAGCRSATAGVILRELIAFADQGADVFFGEPEFDTGRPAADRRRRARAGLACSSCPTCRTGRRCSRPS